MKIESLTREQEALLPVYRDRWLAYGLSTEPVNEDAAIRAVNKCYECANLKPPMKIVFCDSPLSMLLTRAMLLKLSEYGETKASVGDSVWDNVWASVGDSVYGQHDAHWIGLYSFFQEQMRIEGSSKIEGLKQLAMNTGWAFPCADICLVSRRPTVCKLNMDGVIHCEDGPAIAYADGFEIHAWNGTRIPSEWITDAPPPALDLLKWENTEQRRAGCEIVGWHNVIKELNPISVDKDEPSIGELFKVDLPDSGVEQFLVCQCGTGRTVSLPVPPDMKSAAQANAWTYGVDIDVIKNLEVRT